MHRTACLLARTHAAGLCLRCLREYLQRCLFAKSQILGSEMCSELELQFLASRCCVPIRRDAEIQQLKNCSLASCESVTSVFQLHLSLLLAAYVTSFFSFSFFLLGSLPLLLFCVWLMTRGLLKSLVVPMSSRN